MGASKHSYINLLDFNFQVIFMHRKAEQKVKGPTYSHRYNLHTINTPQSSVPPVTMGELSWHVNVTTGLWLDLDSLLVL